jgi:hypothetical protein
LTDASAKNEALAAPVADENPRPAAWLFLFDNRFLIVIFFAVYTFYLLL